MANVAIEDANVQRNVTLTCTLRLIRMGNANMINVNPNNLHVGIDQIENELGRSMGSFIMETLMLQENPDLDVDIRYIMRPHSDVVVQVNRAQPDGNIFNIQTTFSVKYNNQDFWDYDDRFMNADIQNLIDALNFDFSSRGQNIAGIAVDLDLDNLEINMDDEIDFVPRVNIVPVDPANEEHNAPVARGGSRRTNTRRRRRASRRIASRRKRTLRLRR